MKARLSRRRGLRAAAALILLTSMWPALQAAEVFPARPIKLIVPFPPGGPADVMGRSVAKILGDRLKQSVVVENKPGAGGNLGTDLVAKAAPDGYTLGLSAVSSLAISPALMPKLPYKVTTDFTPITLVGIAKGAIVAHPSAPFSDLKGLIAAARAQPGKLSYGSSGIGTANHLAAEVLQAAAGIELSHVPYKGTAALTQDLLAGVLPISFESSLAAAAPNVASGRLKAIAITAATRSPLMPQVPTVAEQGYPGFDVPTWFGLVAPAGLPPEVLALIHRSVVDGLRSPELAERFALIGAEPAPNTPEQFAAYLRAESARWAKVIRDAKITLE